MSIIIAGGGEFGFELAKELNKKFDITVIDKNEKLEEKYHQAGINFIAGNCTASQILTSAGIDQADYFVACTSSDEINIISCWTVKQLGSVETICFVKRIEYIESLQSRNKLLSNFGLDYTIWPKKSLADALEKIVSVPAAIDVEVFVQGKVKLFEYLIKNSTPIADKPLKECNFPDNCIIVGVTRDDELHIPDGNTILKPGDKAIFMGTDDALKALSEKYFEKKKHKKTVTIIGGGTVGYMLATKLEKMNMDTWMIEQDEERCEFLANKLRKTLILKGDGTDIELLQSEQIGQAEVLVSVTDNDEKNLLCSLLGKQLGVSKVLTRVDKTANLKVFEKVGIDVALSPKSSSINELINIVTVSDIDLLAIVDSGRGEVLEVIVSENFEDTCIKDLNMPHKAIIGAVIRSKKVIVPRGNSVIQPSDRLIVFTTKEASTRIMDYFEKIEILDEIKAN
jgi:trk system potassium uptake protein TrkA